MSQYFDEDEMNNDPLEARSLSIYEPMYIMGPVVCES